MLPSHVAVWGGYAQVPLSGTYRIKSANNTYVQIKGKYYAKPDATLADASEVGVGIGYKTGDGYRVYSLTGTNPTDKSQIEVYNYVDRAYQIVSQFAQTELNKKLDAHKDLLQALLSDPAKVEEVKSALDAMADSICNIYTDDYAYMTLVPQAHYGNKWIVRAKATVPAIPYTIQAVGNYVVKGNVVRNSHACTDVWDWAKQHVLKYLDEHQTDQRLKDLATKYLDQVQPGTTYYLSYDKSDNSFGYTLTPTDDGLWTMEEDSTTVDGLTPGVMNIKNNSTNHYVSVAGKYDAEPSLTLSDIEGSDDNKKNAAITLDFGRLNRSDANLYRITELSNQGQDVVGYLAKGMDKVYSVLDAKLSTKDKDGKTYYDKLAGFINPMLQQKGIPDITTAQIRADVQTAVDLCADHYAYMKLVDNGNGSVKLRVDVPQVPALLDLAVEMYQQQKTKDDWKVSDDEVTTQGAKANGLADGDEELATLLKRAESNGSSAFEDFAKEQIDKYFESSETTESLKKLWRQNRDKWHFGHTYYLSAEPTYNTFEFTENVNDAAAQWTLADVNAANSTTNPYKGYFRIKNVGGFNGQQYIDVRGRKTADAAATNEDKVTKPGTILYVNLDATGTTLSSPYVANATVKGFELLNVRSQGLDVMNGSEATQEELKNMFSNVTLQSLMGGDLTPAYAGYVGFARYLLSAGAAFADGIIRNYVNGTDNQTKFDDMMNDFNANYLPNLKFQVYLLPVDGKKDTYLVRSQVPSLKPIVDYYKANKADMDAIVVPAVRKFFEAQSGITSLVGFTGEKFTDDDDATINSWYSSFGGEWHVKNCCEKDAQGKLIKDKDGNYTLSYSTILGSEQIMFDWLKLQMLKALKKRGLDANIGGYVNMIHYNTPYYLIEGDNHDAKGNRVYTGSSKLGFANDGIKANTAGEGNQSTIVNDLTQAKEHAYWTLESVSGDNYFTVKPNSNVAKNGKYYSSTYLDFPFKPTGKDVNAVYVLHANTVNTGKEADGTEYMYVTFDKHDGVVPASTPVIIEYNTPTVGSDLALTPVLSDERTSLTGHELLQGTFLGGKHNVSNSSLTDGTIQQKWGVGTDGMDLYLWGYNSSDTRNPYGFYLYSANDVEETSAYNNIPANKPFLVLGPNNKAKVYVMFGDGEATSISSLLNTTTTMPADAPRYNLAGQRVTDAYKGVVIVNGHKYLQK